MSSQTEVRSARVDPGDAGAVVAALRVGGPRTVTALARLPQFRRWRRARLEIALGAAWVSGRVTIDDDDRFHDAFKL